MLSKLSRNFSLRPLHRSFATQVTKLPSGLTVVTQKTHDPHSTIGIYANAGSRDENLNGESRLLQKAFTRGTKTRPFSKLSEEVEGQGGILSADIGKEHSHVALTVPKGLDTKGGLGLVKDCMFGSISDSTDFEAMKVDAGMAVEEASISTRDLMMDRMFSSVFRDCSLGNTFYPEFTEMYSHESLNAFLKNNFTQDRLVVSAAGAGVDHQTVVTEAEAQFKDVGAKGNAIVQHKPYFLGAMMNYRNDEMGPLVYMVLSWQTVAWRSADALTFMLIAQILGEYTKHNPQSILPSVLSANRFVNNAANRGNGVGCIEYHHAQQHFFRDVGVFSVYAICDGCALEDCRSEIQFIVNMLPGALMNEEVEKAKRELKLKLYSQLLTSDTATKAHLLAQHQIAYGRPVTIDELCARIDDLSAADCRRAAYDYLADSEVSITALGPTHGMQAYSRVREDNVARRF